MKRIVTYFSATGITAEKAFNLAKMTGADLHEIQPEVLYTKEDLDWHDEKSRSSIEMKDPASRPALKEKKTDLSAYDTVFIGFPIWWYTAPRIIQTFIEQNDLSDKSVYLFATSGSTGIEQAVKDLKKKYPEVHFVKGELLNRDAQEETL